MALKLSRCLSISALSIFCTLSFAFPALAHANRCADMVKQLDSIKPVNEESQRLRYVFIQRTIDQCEKQIYKQTLLRQFVHPISQAVFDHALDRCPQMGEGRISESAEMAFWNCEITMIRAMLVLDQIPE